jgi:nitroreductase
MKKLLFILAAAAVMTGCANNDKQQNQQSMNEQIVLDNIATRTSIRQFTGEKILQEHVDKLLHAAMSAPSAINRQPWAFVVVTDQQLLDQMGEAMPNCRCNNGAAVAFVMCGDMTKAIDGDMQGFWIHDVSAATENLLLAAHAMGLGAVWTGVYPRMERVKMVQDFLSLPEHIIPLCIVPVGVPAEQPAVKDKYNAEIIHYNKW